MGGLPLAVKPGAALWDEVSVAEHSQALRHGSYSMSTESPGRILFDKSSATTTILAPKGDLDVPAMLHTHDQRGTVSQLVV